MSLDETIAAMVISLGRDTHLERCDLAKRGGPDGTLARAECGRARWMHRTRHDTCGQFCYVTVNTITDVLICAVGLHPDTSAELRNACRRATNIGLYLGDGLVRDAKRDVAMFINATRNRLADAAAGDPS